MALPKSTIVVFAQAGLSADDIVIVPLPFEEKHKNLFGLHKKTERLPGHHFYHQK